MLYKLRPVVDIHDAKVTRRNW